MMQTCTKLFLAAFVTFTIMVGVFHMPPKSTFNSETYFAGKADHRVPLSKMTNGVYVDCAKNGYQLRINSFVQLPSTVGIYKAHVGNIDTKNLAEAMGMKSNDSTIEASTMTFNAAAYTMNFYDIFFENGYISCAENGYIENAVAYPEHEIDVWESFVRKMLSDAHIYSAIPYEVNNAEGIWFVSPIIDGIVMTSIYSVYDVTGIPSLSSSIQLVQDMNKISMTGQWFDRFERVCDVDALVPVERCAGAILDFADQDLFFDEIRLAYQARIVLGDPYHNVLYPVWELYNHEITDLPLCIVNALSGSVERLW